MLVKCKSCGAQVGDGAVACPKCGELFAGTHIMRGVVMFVGFAAVLLGLLYLLGGIEPAAGIVMMIIGITMIVLAFRAALKRTPAKLT